MKKIRLGIVGLGHRGRFMFRLASQNFDNVEPVAMCDIEEKFWAERQTRPSCEPTSMKEDFPSAKFYTDFDAMLMEANLDALLVETPAANHTDFCVKGLEHNLSVLSDVPFAATVEEANRLWDTAKKSKGMFMAGANPNEMGFVEALVDLYAKGYLGKISYLEAEYIHDCRSLWEVTPWRAKGSVPIKYCTHSLGPLLRILEEDLRTVSCHSTGSWICPENPDHNDLMTATFSTDSHVVFRLTTSFINNAHIGCHNYRVFGTEGYFERFSGRGKLAPATLFSSNKLYGAKNLTELPVDASRAEFGSNASLGHGGADYALVKRFLSAIEGKCEPISLREGLRMTIPGIYAAESAKQGGKLLRIVYPWE